MNSGWFKKGQISKTKGVSSYPRVIGTCLFCEKNMIVQKIKDNYKGRKFCNLSCKSSFVARDRKTKGLPIGIPLKIGNTNRKGKPNSRESILKFIESRKWYRPTIETRQKISKAGIGRKHTEETKKKMSDLHEGEKSYLFGTHLSESRRRKIGVANSGAKSHLWRGGITPLNKKIRGGIDYKLWRESVFKRDDWTCVICNVRGVTLNADHIKPFAYFPELRLNIDNGRTLCVPCHEKTDTYKYKAKKYEKQT